MIQKSFIQEMLNLQNHKVKYSTISALGSFLVLYTALFPFSNNILEAFYPEIKTSYIKAAESSASTVIWCFGMCIQATFIIVLQFLKPYILSYAFPLFSSLYSSAFYFYYLQGIRPNENYWFFFYIILSVIILLISMYIIQFYIKIAKKRDALMRNAMLAILED